MDPKKLFFDDRFSGVCLYCGNVANSRDHVPSKAFLDEPYPQNLPVAEACESCNQGFSSSEEYLACLLECVKNGTTVPNSDFRPKIAKTLKSRPAIAQRIEAAKTVSDSGELFWQVELDRVREVILKLARGHIAYELGMQRIDEPRVLEIVPIPSMAEANLKSFVEIAPSGIHPEIGSRSFVNSLQGNSTAYETWKVVQASRYRYAVGQGAGDWVKMVLGEYLACYVAWD